MLRLFLTLCWTMDKNGKVIRLFLTLCWTLDNNNGKVISHTLLDARRQFCRE